MSEMRRPSLDPSRRRAALARADHRCQVCNSPDQLEAHHRTYDRVGDEAPGDLTVLCDRCHRLFHHTPRLRDPDWRREAEARFAERRPEEMPVEIRLLSAAEVADTLGLSRIWVYKHADELGGLRLGTGPKAPIRFHPAELDSILAAWNDEREPQTAA